MRPFSRKWDEKKTFMLSSGSFRKACIRFISSLAPASASSASSESESDTSSDLASTSVVVASAASAVGASAASAVESLTGAGICSSRPMYIRNCANKR
jgi:hypothetical protein